jgi:glucose/arabinose dehydrogenase
MPERRAIVHGSVVRGALCALVVSLCTAQASALTLAAEAATDFDVAEAAASLGNPIDVAELPDGRFVVIEKGGNVKTFTPGTEDPVVSQITLVTDGQNEQGLLGIVADPDFATNNYVYIYASVGQDQNNRHQVRRYVLGADGKLGAMKPVIDMGLMGPANHNGGGLSIYGGFLFVGVGDTGKNNGTPHNHIGSCLNKANGKVLRVSLAEATLGQPPADNPLMTVDMVTGCDDSSANDDAPFVMKPPEKRIYSWGFRNPFRIWADPMTGKVWVGDVGEVTLEEIDVVEKGKHYGWPFEEGTQKYTKAQQAFQPDNTCMGMTPPSACIPPITDYATKGPPDQEGAVMGGRILDGCGWPDKWKSRYIFGDHEQNKVWSIDVNGTRDGMVANSKKDFATTNGVTAMRMGTDNALYVVERGAGTVTRITAKAAPAAMPGSCLTTNPMPGGGMGGSGGGGSGGSGGAAGSASAGQSSGGTSSGGSGTSPGGSMSAGGSTSTTGGSGSNVAGSTSTTAGSGNPATGGGDDGGCGCRMATGRSTAAFGLSALGAALGLVLGRRRARRS